MTTETEAGNKIIAEFMEHPFIVTWQKDNPGGEFDFKYFFKYHSSWDWFHGVWEKFSVMKLREGEDDNFNDTYNKHLVAISTAIIHFSIETAHARLVKGIQWYQSQQTQPT